MTTYLGLDIGTSSVKAVLVGDGEKIIATASASLEVSRPHAGWSEQDGDSWITATQDAIDQLKASHPKDLSAVAGIGLSGQMHGATLLDAADKPLRPAILWNDVRSAAECGELEARCPELRAIAGNIAMPGFTAPKLAWVKKHEPEIFAKTAKVLLPKDYVRLWLVGDYVSDMSGRRRYTMARRRQARLVERAAGCHRSHARPHAASSSRARNPRARCGPSWFPVGAFPRRR